MDGGAGSTSVRETSAGEPGEPPRYALLGVRPCDVRTSARIVPPTLQNQASIENDLRRFVASRLDLDDQQLTWQCEQAIRNYDPCISCATHFLDLTVDRA